MLLNPIYRPIIIYQTGSKETQKPFHAKWFIFLCSLFLLMPKSHSSFKKMSNVYGCFSASMSMYHVCASSIWRQKRMLNPLGLELQKIPSSHVGIGS